MHRNNGMKVSIALAAPLLAGTYEKSAGAAPAVDDGGIGRRGGGGWERCGLL